MRHAPTRTLPESGGRRVEVRGSAGPGAHALDEKSWGDRTKKGQLGGTTRREKKKAMACWNGPLAGGKQQGVEGKQRALGKEKAAETRLERGKRKKTNFGFSDFRHYALECPNVGMPRRR